MKITAPRNAQTNTKSDYAGTDELWASEKYLVNYNQDLILKLTKNQRTSSDVLEFGAGIGTLANLWERETGIKPECLEIDPKQRAIIESRGFFCYNSMISIEKKFDVIYTSNVLEHIEDDQLILNELISRLKDGGSLIIYVPAFQVLYSDLDEKVGHFRRYQKRDLLRKLKKSGFEVTKFFYSDSIGFFAWLYVKMKGYSPEKSVETSMRIYDKFVFPLSKLIDALGCKFLFGKNLLVYAKKSK